MAKSNIPSYITTAIRAADSVNNSQTKHHNALIALICAIADMDDADAFAHLTLYTQDRVTRSPNSLCTKATVAWLEENFGVHVTKTGIAKRGRTWEGKGFNLDTKTRAQANPWYDLARDLAFKLPTALSLKAVASQAVKREIAGAPLPTPEELYAAFMDDVRAMRKSERVKDWAAEYKVKLAAGEVESLAPEADDTTQVA